jgi:hypothetical protein
MKPSSFATPAGLLKRALALWLFFAAVHMAGLRDAMSLLSGTKVYSSLGVTAIAAAAYLSAYLGAVVAAPILALAAVILRITEAVAGGHGGGGASRSLAEPPEAQ